MGDTSSVYSDKEIVSLLGKKYAVHQETGRIEFRKNNGKFFYSAPILSDEPFSMKQIWYPVSQTEYRLCYEVIWFPKDGTGWVSTILDANSGNILSEKLLMNDLDFDNLIDSIHFKIDGGCLNNSISDTPRIIQSAQYGIYPMPAESPMLANAPLIVTPNINLNTALPQSVTIYKQISKLVQAHSNDFTK